MSQSYDPEQPKDLSLYLLVPRQRQPPRQTTVQVGTRSPALAVLVSAFLPGVGSMMAGKADKGTNILVCYVTGWVLCLVVVGFVVAPAFWIWGMVAAYRDTVAWNAAHRIG
jgi:TM2 domain-containing membrane protein YozV